MEPDELFGKTSTRKRRTVTVSQFVPAAVVFAAYTLPVLFGMALVLVLRQPSTFGGFTGTGFIMGVVTCLIAIVAGYSSATRIATDDRRNIVLSGLVLTAAIVALIPAYGTTAYLFLVAAKYGYERVASAWYIVIVLGTLSFHFVRAIAIANLTLVKSDDASESQPSLHKGVYRSVIGAALGAWIAASWIVPRFGPGAGAIVCVVLLLLFAIPLMHGWRRVHYLTAVSIAGGALIMHGTLERGLLATATIDSNVEIRSNDETGRLSVAHNSGWLTGEDAIWLDSAALTVAGAMQEERSGAGAKALLLGVPASRIAAPLPDGWAATSVASALRSATTLEVTGEAPIDTEALEVRDPMAHLADTTSKSDFIYINVEGHMGRAPEHLRGTAFYRAVADNLTSQGRAVIAVATDPLLRDDASQATDDTIRSAFGRCSTLSKHPIAVSPAIYICGPSSD